VREVQAVHAQASRTESIDAPQESDLMSSSRTGFTARGFTLIELMITVAIVAVISAVALPSYLEHVRRSTRTEVQSYLQAVVTRQNQFLVDSRSFTTDLAVLAVPLSTSGQAAYDFEVTLVAGPPRGFVLKATPKGRQMGEPCGVMTITQTGAKTAARSGCW
jgi:type IV pilus assembly protein PilE